MAALGVLSRVEPYNIENYSGYTEFIDGLITYSDGTQEVIPNKQNQNNEEYKKKQPVAVATAANTPSSEELLRDIRNLSPPLNEDDVNSIIGAYNASDSKRAFFGKYPLTRHKFNVANILFNTNGEKKNNSRLSIGGHKRKSHRRKSHKRKSHKRKSHKRKVK